MKCSAGIFFIVVALTRACSEPSTTIEIQNYDGPIYLHIPAQNEEDPVPHHQCHNNHHPPMEIECTCVAKPSVKYIPINTASETSCGHSCNSGSFYPGTYNSGYPGICSVGSSNTGTSNSCNPSTCNTCNPSSCNTCNPGTCGTGSYCPVYPYYNGGSNVLQNRGTDKIFVTMDIANPNSYGSESGTNCNCPRCNSGC